MPGVGEIRRDVAGRNGLGRADLLGESKIHDFDESPGRDPKIRGFNITVDYISTMRFGQAFRALDQRV